LALQLIRKKAKIKNEKPEVRENRLRNMLVAADTTGFEQK
jgi:hypothetical protein